MPALLEQAPAVSTRVLVWHCLHATNRRQPVKRHRDVIAQHRMRGLWGQLAG